MVRRVATLIALLLGPAHILAAQEVGSLAGTVRDTAGIVIVGADVLLGTRRLQTSLQGRFQIDSLPVGNHFLTIRLVGYTALRTPVTVRAGISQYTYVLHAAVQSLPTVSVGARRLGLYGTVGDSAFAPLAGANVHLAGRGGGEALTDSAGRFAFSRTIDGPYVVRVVLPGYAEERLFIELTRREGRELAIRLRPSHATVASVDVVAVQELGRRLATNLASDRLSARQLERYGSLGLCDLPGFASRLGVPPEGLTIILNGTVVLRDMPVHALCSWRASDVELVEFGNTVCRDATRTLVYLLDVWCTRFNERGGVDHSLSARERAARANDAVKGPSRIQRRGGPFVVLWERR